MEPTNMTVRILEQIRDSIGETNSRIDQTNSRIEQTNSRIDQTNAKLDQKFDVLTERVGVLTDRVDVLTEHVDALTSRVVDGEIRMATAITGVAGTLGQMKTLLEDRLDLRGRVERCEQDIVLLKEQTGVK